MPRTPNHHRRRRSALPCALAAAFSAGASAQTTVIAEGPQQLPEVQIRGHYLNAVGTSDAASQGTVTSRLIENRPAQRTAELLEFVPGVIVTQHSGDGKANQYFLRGFNLDHGTDFATFVDGMPVNMPTHAHGHGYSDLNWLIPELVERIDYKKGPYFADEGDFAAAGAARIRQIGKLPQGIATATLGERGYRRALVANSAGGLLYALEGAHNDGPWESPEKFHRTNLLLRHGSGEGANRMSLTAMAYTAGWNATDQIPLRAVNDGLIGRFGTVDPTDGGRTSRVSLSLNAERGTDDGRWAFDAYAIRSRLQLYSNFTFFLDDPVNGDQFEQAERRTVAGLATRRIWNTTLAGRPSTHTIGLQLRHDRLDPVGLYPTLARQRLGVTQESVVRQTGLGVHAEAATQWTPWLRSIAGLRADRYAFDVKSSIAVNSDERRAGIVSPKLSLVFGPWQRTELFVNAGRGFHSNDARGTTATVKAKAPTEAAARVDPLVRATGSELGLRTEIVRGLQSSLALWQLRLRSELLFVGDAGETEATRASRRHGIEWNNHYAAASWLLLDADLALSRARYADGDPDGVGKHIPGAIERVVSLGATVTELGRWFGHFQLRHFGGRALVEDDSQRSKGTTLASLRAGYKLAKDVKIAVEVFNLFDRRASDIDYYYESRLRGESAGTEDIHFHPVEPRSIRVTLSASFRP